MNPVCSAKIKFYRNIFIIELINYKWYPNNSTLFKIVFLFPFIIYMGYQLYLGVRSGFDFSLRPLTRVGLEIQIESTQLLIEKVLEGEGLLKWIARTHIPRPKTKTGLLPKSINYEELLNTLESIILKISHKYSEFYCLHSFPLEREQLEHSIKLSSIAVRSHRQFAERYKIIENFNKKMKFFSNSPEPT